jgi:hypothetical protein
MSTVTLISPINSTQYVELAQGERSSIAYLLTLITRAQREPLVVIDGSQEVPACHFINRMYGAGLVSMRTTTRPKNIDYDYQLAAMC